MELRSDLFVDFDNIFGGLMELDRAAGLSFAREPARWQRFGTYGLADERERRLSDAGIRAVESANTVS